MGLYEYLHEPKGKAYRDDQMKNYSLLKIYPSINNNKKLRGKSRIIGDVDKETQNAIIDMIIAIAVRYSLNYKEISYILLTSKRESGFNPDAAAGITSAAGLAQATVAFISDAKLWSKGILGFTLNLDEMEVFDAEKGCFALIYSFILNKLKVSKYFTVNDINYWKWLYILHHDGINSLDQYMAGGRKISKDGDDVANYILNHLPKVEELLKSTKVNTSFKLSANDDTPIANKNYVATVSLSLNKNCPSIASNMNDPLIFFKGKTDNEGKTEEIRALTGSEIIFTILKDNYKKLAILGSVSTVEESKKEDNVKKIPHSSGKSVGDSKNYSVKSGDTLSAIAKKHGTTVESLAELNNLRNANVLHIGQVLKLSVHKKNHMENQQSTAYISRYLPEQVKQTILKYLGIENGNTKAAISYSRSHIVLPTGSVSADVDRNKNVVHIKTTTNPESIKRKKKQVERHQTDAEGTAKPTIAPQNFEPKIKFLKGIKDEARVSKKSKDIIKKIASSAGLHIVYVTSTLRTPEEQAKALYDNIKSKGVASQLAYYSKNGDDVVQVAVSAGIDNENAAINAMVKKIKNLHSVGKIVSRHCVSEEMYSKKNVLDISKNKAGLLAKKFDQAIKKYIKENNDVAYISPFINKGEPAFHLEIQQ